MSKYRCPVCGCTRTQYDLCTQCVRVRCLGRECGFEAPKVYWDTAWVRNRSVLRKIAMWFIDHVPLGPLAPHVFGFALGSKPKKVTEDKP